MYSVRCPGQRSWIRRVTWTPSRSGSTTSTMTSWTPPFAVSSTSIASSPLSASNTRNPHSVNSRCAMRRTVGVSSTTRILGALRTSGRRVINPPDSCARRGLLAPRRAGEKALLIASGAVGAGADGIPLGGDWLALVGAGPGDALAPGRLPGLGVGHARLGLIALGRIGPGTAGGGGAGGARPVAARAGARAVAAGAARAVHVAVHSGISLSGVRAHSLAG